MFRFAAFAMALTFCFSLAAQDRPSTKNGTMHDDPFPSISKDQTRETKGHRARVFCDTSCAGPGLVCHYSECYQTTKPVYCMLSVPFDGGCNCQPCNP